MQDHVVLNNGAKMPIIGYGMWQSDNHEELETALDNALEAGYRHFDTAYGYQNEDVLGRAIKKWITNGKVKREELFIVTKLPVFGGHPDRVENLTKISLQNLQLDYVDLYLIHNPAVIKANEEGTNVLFVDGKVIPDTTSTLEEAWKAMEAQVDAGRAKAIGLSNFSVSQVERIEKIARIKPANHQVELNATYPKKALRDLAKKFGSTICAFAPLGSPGRKEYYASTGSNLKVAIPTLLENPIVVEIAERLNVTPAQVLLRFLAQQGVVVIPKSVTPSRIVSNFQIFNFNLTQDDMNQLDTLDSGKEGSWGFDWRNGFPGIENHPEFQLEIQEAKA